MNRREVLQCGVVGMAAAVAGLLGREVQGRSSAAAKDVAPSLFVAHGTPWEGMLPQTSYSRELGAFATSVARPEVIGVVSAHWQTQGGIRVTAARSPETIHDFGGFPEALYQLRYPAPGAPEWAARITAQLTGAGQACALEPVRGLDHGAWVPLLRLYPQADVPVVQISLPARATPTALLQLGRSLAPLREQGLLLMGSGGIIHNLRRLDWDREAPVSAWARAFDQWMAERLEKRELSSLIDYRRLAPEAASAVPTTEHLDPLFVVLGASLEGDVLQTVHEGFTHSSLSMRSIGLRILSAASSVNTQEAS